MENQQPPINDDSKLESLEDPATIMESPDPAVPSVAPGEQLKPLPNKPAPKGPAGGLRNRFKFFNIYLLGFALVVVIAAVAGIVAYISGQHSAANNTGITAQTLDQKALEQIAASDATVGSTAQVLNVQSNAVFAGKVLVRDTLEVAGQLQVGGSLSLSGVTVSGSSSFDQVQVNKNLAVAGDTGIQGTVTVQKSLSVNGNGNFGGSLSATQITTSNLQLNGNLNLTHHITAGGPTPSRSNGSALGSGGTASISGSDTSGSVSINTGGSAAAGCFVTINFASKFSTTPHVIVSPVGSNGGGIAYYVNRSTSSFSICTSAAPPSNASFGFDYFVLD